MFKKYNSIENTYRTEFLDRIKSHGFWKHDYIVQEKVHGSNLSYWTCDGQTFFSAKRTSNIKADERFYNHEIVREGIKSKLQHIWNALKEREETVTQMTIFGEIMGGNYPHPEVARNTKAIKVQKGISYSPDNLFFAFDILINHEAYLNVDVANALFEAANMLHAKTLFEGPIEEALRYKNAFQTTVPDELGLPPIENNICEGVIIRPKQTLFFHNGSRVIMKNKNEKWTENKVFKKKIRKEEKLSEKVVKLREAILTYVTENRLNNVLSKIGEVTDKDFGKIMGLFNKDIVEDFSKDYAEILDTLDKKELQQVNKSIAKETAGMIRTRLFYSPV